MKDQEETSDSKNEWRAFTVQRSRAVFYAGRVEKKRREDQVSIQLSELELGNEKDEILTWSRSSVMVSLTPPPFGIETHGFPPSPITKTLPRRVEKSRPRGSRTWTICIERKREHKSAGGRRADVSNAVDTWMVNLSFERDRCWGYQRFHRFEFKGFHSSEKKSY